MKKLLTYMLFSGLATLMYAQDTTGGTAPDSAKVKKVVRMELPDHIVYDMEGNPVNARTLGKDGKPFAICFWAIWNKEGLLELNNLMENYKDWHDDHHLTIYAICIDEESRIPRAKQYIDVHEWQYNVLFDKNGELEHAMKISGVPHLMLFDENGQVIWQEHSYHSGVEQEFLDEVHKLKK